MGKTRQERTKEKEKILKAEKIFGGNNLLFLAGPFFQRARDDNVLCYYYLSLFLRFPRLGLFLGASFQVSSAPYLARLRRTPNAQPFERLEGLLHDG